MRLGGLIAGFVLVATACGSGEPVVSAESSDADSSTTTSSDVADTTETGGVAQDDTESAPAADGNDLFAGGVHVGRWNPNVGWVPNDGGYPQPPTRVDIVGVTADIGSPLTVSADLASNDPCQTVLDLGSGATGLSWDLFPRPMATVIAADEHRAAVVSVLETDGLTDPVVELREALRVDLEGDGVDEVVLAATLGGEPYFASLVGDHSLVVVRVVTVDGQVENIPLAVTSTSQADADAAGPDADLTDHAAVPTAHHDVVDVVDLNGDGVYEIVISSRGDHSLTYQVFDPTIGFDQPVLESGCTW